MAEPGIGFGLYVHWPFCQAKCPYCDFNSHVTARIDQQRWATALASEIARAAAETGDRTLTSVFFGGGTPSLMDVATVDTVMMAVREGWSLASDLEVTMEANPTSVDAARFEGYARAGVNRLSLGVQALNDADLKRLGRLHSVAEARGAFDVARQVFERVSFDLICARQDQTADAWRAELREALSMAVDHISLYQLTIEPGTAFADRFDRGGLRGLPDEDLGADLYEITVEECAAAGLERYEISNFARPGAECRHNLLYWSGGDYCGVGPGAHGRLTREDARWATEQPSAPGAWLAAAESGGPTEGYNCLSPSDQAEEYLLMGLRKREGIHLPTLVGLKPPPEHFWSRVDHLSQMGMLYTLGDRLCPTDQGRLVLNAVLTELTAE